jgi:2-polyprenyl-6-methoxyphenol hydroxylase-like FAD-dependent oxidoreductase
MAGNPVLIVGAGPTGLVLGIELARRGVPFQLVDRHVEPSLPVSSKGSGAWWRGSVRSAMASGR